jgi:hypothetical protein
MVYAVGNVNESLINIEQLEFTVPVFRVAAQSPIFLCTEKESKQDQRI